MAIRPAIRLALLVLTLFAAVSSTALAQEPFDHDAAPLEESLLPTAADAVVLSPQEQDALTRINAYRAALGLRPVRLDPVLQQEAEWYANDMAVHDNFNHDHRDSLGRLPASRLAAFNYRFPDLAAENSAAGYADGASTFEQWRLSPPHERTMRESTYRTIGIAAAYREGSSSGWYWVSTFGPNPNRSRQAIEDEQAAADDDAQGGGRTSVTIPVLPLPRVVLAPCELELRRPDEQCVTVSSNTRRSPIELQVQRRGAGSWSKATFVTADSKMIRIRRGIARVRVLAYDPDNRWPTRGPWRVIRP
jgi:uncharacterized protein YkwD